MDNQHPLNIDLSWLACAIEGEGCITIEKSGKMRKDGGRCLVPKVVVTNTNADFINAAKKIVESIGLAPYIKNIPRKEGWKEVFVLQIHTHEPVRKLLTAIRPFLRSKIGQCELVLSFIASRQSNEKPKSVPYSENERGIVVEIRKLNQRGVRDCTPTTEQSVKDTVHSDIERVG